MRLYNFRDLGGLTTRCERKIKTGQLFRTGNVAHWSDDAAEHVTQYHKIKMYIDFRHPEEVKRFGRPEALLRQNVDWVSLAIDTSDKKFESLRLPKVNDWLDLYQNLFEKNLKTWERFIQMVSEVDQPLMYGCLFGKDRTGIATSFLLNVLDVHDDLIVADYSRTTHEVQPLADLFKDMLDHKGASEEEIFEHFSRSHESVMFGFLEYIRTHPEDHRVGEAVREWMQTYRPKLQNRLLVKNETENHS